MDEPEQGKTYDEILSHIGAWGLYQKRMLLFAFLVCAGEGLHLINTIFTMGAQDFRCAVPGLVNDTFHIQSEDHAHLLNASIPWDTKKEGYSQCLRYRTTVTNSSLMSGETESCSRWVYSTQVFGSSIMSELSMVCDRDIYISHANMMSMAGLMLGSMVGGTLSDLFGRKKSFVFFYWFHMIVAFCSVLATNIPAFLIARLLIAATGIAFYMSIFVLCAELVPSKKRVTACTVNNLGWTLGMLLLLLLAYFFRYWKTLQLALSIPLIPAAIACFWLVPESPRWLMNKGRYSDAQKVLAAIARVNKTELPEKVLLQNMHGQKVEKKTSHHTKASEKSLILLLRSPTLALRLAVLSFSWAVNSMVYYGVTLNMGAIIEGDIYINFLIMAVLEILSYAIVPVVMRYIGRKVFLCACVFVGGGACLATIIPLVFDFDSPLLNIVLSNLGKFGITSAFGIVWIYTSELLPTPARQSGIGFCSFIGRVGGIISPYIATLHTVIDGPFGKAAPLLVFGASAVVAGILCLMLPETRKRPLPETVEEAEKMKR